MRLMVFTAILVILLCHACLGKTGRTLYTDEQVRQARDNVAKYDWAKAVLQQTATSVEWVLDMSDEELWEFIPPADQPRALNVCFGVGCPVHGKEVFKVGANYPWIMDRNLPFKVKCPVGGEIYPSNDFRPWHDGGSETGDGSRGEPKYHDDGYGWTDENGSRYWFVGHYIFWQRWRRDILPVIPNLAFAYILTGDTRYAHKAAVMLTRIASEYPKMDYRTQSYHNGRYPSGYNGKILDLDWEGDGTVTPLARAYDQVYDAFDGDAELKAFLERKGISDPHGFIEANFLQEAARAIESNTIHGNMNYQEQLAVVATVLDNRDASKGLTTEQMVDWIMNGGGEMNTLLYNGISRDGAGSEESIGYTTIWARAFYDLAERLKPLGYDLYANTRLKKMADFYIDTAVADQFSPRIGDAGELMKPTGPVWGAYLFRKPYELWRDPRYAKVLNRIGWPQPSIYESPDALEADKKEAEAFGTDLGPKTRDLGGYGLAVLESGGQDKRRAVTMFYGCSGAWHGHWDRLNIEMWAYGRQILPEVGYPAHWGSKADLWVRSTPSHYCVLIDENRQAKMEGYLNLLASGPGVQVMDASAEEAYPGTASLYRRTVAMVDASPEDSYLIDIFRVKGGRQHDYSFHGLPFGEFGVSGVSLGPTQAGGTLMGEDIEFGKVFDGMKTGGYQYLFNVRRGAPEGEWSANWLVEEDGLGLKMAMLPGSAHEVIVADCEPEPKPGNPEKMQYVLARNTGGSSTYVAVIEPYLNKPVIRHVQSLGPDGEDIAAVRVDCRGRTDYVLSASDAARTFHIAESSENAGTEEAGNSGEITFYGEFGAVTEDSRGLRSMLLVNGSELSKDGYGLRLAEPLRARGAAVDYSANSVTLDRKLPMPDAVVEQVIVISNAQHRTSYTVTGAETRGGRTVLHFGDISPIEGMCEIKAVDDAENVVETSTRLGGYGIKWAGKLFPGRRVLNEALTESWLITSYDNARFAVQADSPISAKLADANGDGHSFFYIGDFGPGDEVMVPCLASIERTEDGTFDIRATAPFDLSFPAQAVGETAVERMSGGRWEPLQCERSGSRCTVAVDRGIISRGSGKIRIR